MVKWSSPAPLATRAEFSNMMRITPVNRARAMGVGEGLFYWVEDRDVKTGWAPVRQAMTMEQVYVCGQAMLMR